MSAYIDWPPVWRSWVTDSRDRRARHRQSQPRGIGQDGTQAGIEGRQTPSSHLEGGRSSFPSSDSPQQLGESGGAI